MTREFSGPGGQITFAITDTGQITFSTTSIAGINHTGFISFAATSILNNS